MNLKTKGGWVDLIAMGTAGCAHVEPLLLSEAEEAFEDHRAAEAEGHEGHGPLACA